MKKNFYDSERLTRLPDFLLLLFDALDLRALLRERRSLEVRRWPN